MITEIILSEDVRKYIRELSSIAEKAQISRYIDRQEELGHRLKEPVSKHLRDGIHEIRPGPHRVLFFFDKSRIVLIHAFRKKTRETPTCEIEAAIRKKDRWARYA